MFPGRICTCTYMYAKGHLFKLQLLQSIIFLIMILCEGFDFHTKEPGNGSSQKTSERVRREMTAFCLGLCAKKDQETRVKTPILPSEVL